MAYADLNTIHNPATGTVAPAAWGDQVRDNLEFLIDPPTCSVFNSVVQSVPNSTATILTANSETFDNDSMHSTVTNTARITIQTPGRYLIVATIDYANNATSYRSTGFNINGSISVVGGMSSDAVNGNATRHTAARTAVFAAGDFIQVFAQQLSGGNLDVTLREFAALFLTR